MICNQIIVQYFIQVNLKGKLLKIMLKLKKAYWMIFRLFDLDFYFVKTGFHLRTSESNSKNILAYAIFDNF
jgi:hypothetical protein